MGKRKTPEDVPPAGRRNPEVEMDADEERKMEEFFQLLERVRKMRKLCSTGGEERKKELTFQWEDFAGAAAPDKNNLPKGTPTGTRRVMKETTEDGGGSSLDLRLRL